MQGFWQTVTKLPPLCLDELQIWRIALPGAGTNLVRCSQMLTPDEAARANRLREGPVRSQFVVARAVLRVLLGNLLAVDPTGVALETGPYGKPMLTEPSVRFNLAHTTGIALIALARACEVGIDVELVTRETEALDIARHSFSANEIRELETVAGTQDLAPAFFRCWTRKEAIIKADGRGLSLPLASFSVPVLARAVGTAVRVPEGERSGDRSKTLYLTDLPCGDELAASVAVRSIGLRLNTLEFPLRRLLLD